MTTKRQPQFKSRIRAAESQLRRLNAQNRLTTAQADLTAATTDQKRLAATIKIAEAERDIAKEDARDKGIARAKRYRKAKKGGFFGFLDNLL